MKKILARLSSVSGQKTEQPLHDHLQQAAEKSYEIGSKVGLGYITKLAGYLHDVGKAAALFQNVRLQGGKVSFDHTFAGFYILRELIESMTNGWGQRQEWLQLVAGGAIISHHVGLPDFVSSDCYIAERISDPDYELSEVKRWLEEQDFYQDVLFCLKKSFLELFDTNGVISNIGRIQKEAGLKGGKQPYEYSFSFLIRLVSGILHAADFEDTSECLGQFTTKKYDSKALFHTLGKRLDSHIAKFPQNTEIEQQRKILYESCAVYSAKPQGIYTLSGPVGSGKTFGYMRFALGHAEAHGLDRIICAVPYLSVVSQNCDSVRRALGLDDSDLIVERDSITGIPDRYRPENILDAEQAMDAKRYALSVSSLNAPICFTTMVQLENALFSNSYSSYHALPALIHSVIVIDEIQLLGLKKYHNLILSLNLLAKLAHTTILLCTATVPEFVEHLSYKLDYAPAHEILADPAGMRSVFDRTQVYNLLEQGPLSCEAICDLTVRTMQDKNFPNALLVLNRKRDTEECYDRLKNLPGFHVIRFNANGKMYLRKIEKEIREHLAASRSGKERFILVATSIIEVGMDFSFAAGFREITSLPSLEQTFGRVDRNGEYGRKSPCYIFKMREPSAMRKMGPDIDQPVQTAVTDRLLDSRKADGVPSSVFFSADLYRAYFASILKSLKNSSYMSYPCDSSDLLSILSGWIFSKSGMTGSRMHSAYSAFRSIETDACLVLCDTPEAHTVVEQLRGGTIKGISKEYHKIILDNSITIYPYQIEALRACGLIECVGDIQILSSDVLDEYGAVLG